jgi:hypothetical protein
MLISDMSDPAPKRRRIIQQPLRTEAPVALIASDVSAVSELEARLKRDHPLITFPSLSHFLAEPPRMVGVVGREPWAFIVVARAGAWDARLDNYVRRRRSIALFGLPEEGYGWPEEIARLGQAEEIDGWLERLNAPEPPAITAKRLVKRQPRAQAKPAAGDDSTPSWLKKNSRVWEALASSTTAPGASGAQPSAAATTTCAPAQLELTEITAAAHGRRSSRPPAQGERTPKLRAGSAKSEKREARRIAREQKAAQRAAAREQKAAQRATAREQKAAQRATAREEKAAQRARKSAAVSAARAKLVRASARPAPQPAHPSTELALSLARSILREGLPSAPRAEQAFARIAAEVGLLRASELLEDLNQRAALLARSISSAR